MGLAYGRMDGWMSSGRGSFERLVSMVELDEMWMKAPRACLFGSCADLAVCFFLRSDANLFI